jgi:hypothetical protein
VGNGFNFCGQGHNPILPEEVDERTRSYESRHCRHFIVQHAVLHVGNLFGRDLRRRDARATRAIVERAILRALVPLVSG